MASSCSILEPIAPYERVTLPTVKSQIGLVQNFFLAKLHANGDEPLLEDEDLPTKQRYPKPRLPPTGKILSPRKRPAKDQGGNKSKKKKTEHKKDGGDVVVPGVSGAGVGAGGGGGVVVDKSPFGGGAAGTKGGLKPAVGKLKLAMPGGSTSSSGAAIPGTANNPTSNPNLNNENENDGNDNDTSNLDAAADPFDVPDDSPTIQHQQTVTNARADKMNKAAGNNTAGSNDNNDDGTATGDVQRGSITDVGGSGGVGGGGVRAGGGAGLGMDHTVMGTDTGLDDDAEDDAEDDDDGGGGGIGGGAIGVGVGGGT